MLPELRLNDWRATKDTLHLYCQVVGKARLATTAPRNHWWNVPLYVDVRGLTTRRLHHAGTPCEIKVEYKNTAAPDKLRFRAGVERIDDRTIVSRADTWWEAWQQFYF